MIRRVVCGISGGVDSAVAGYILKKKGFDVVGVYMKNWDPQDESGTCLTNEQDLEDARKTCDQLGIPLQEVSFVKEYWNQVFSTLLEDYEAGMTPNPDILCNRFIKFGAFYKYAQERFDAQAIATGHYATTSFGDFLQNYKENKWVKLIRAKDYTKDQTLFLSQVEQEPLRKTMFPLGSWYKIQVRQLAETLNLSVSTKKDSTGICFVGKRKFSDFIKEYIPDQEGLFVDVDTGEILGQHKGIHKWTLGQGSRIPGSHQKYFIASKDPLTQTIHVAKGHYHPSLFTNSLITLPPHWISRPPTFSSSKPFTCMFKFQHTEWTVPCQVWPHDRGKLRLELSFPTRAITPGQVAVFYHKNECLGGAKILWNGSAHVSLDLRQKDKSISDEGLKHAAGTTII